MAKLLFCWELGAGRGHLVPHLPLAERLRERGHEVIFAVRHLRHAESLLGSAGFRYLQAPTWITTQPASGVAIRSYAQMLLNVGYGDDQTLVSRSRAWLELFSLLGADILVTDHAPTALLAARAAGLPCAQLGNGFTVPPLLAPLPALVGETDEPILADEARALAQVNATGQLIGAEPLEHLADLFDTGLRVVRSYAEFDHYGERDDVRYVPVQTRAGGETPVWPGPGRPRAFAYLRPGPLLIPVLKVLARRRITTLVASGDLPAEVVESFAGETLTFTDRVYDLRAVAREADLLLLNANHSTTLELLAAGSPVVLLPQQLEQALFAQRVAALGAGQVVTEPRQTAVDLAIEALLQDARHREAAQAFAARHAQTDIAAGEEDLVRRIEALQPATGRVQGPGTADPRALH